MLAFMPGITGAEYVPGDSRFRIGDLIGVTLRGVPEDDGDYFSTNRLNPVGSMPSSWEISILI